MKLVATVVLIGSSVSPALMLCFRNYPGAGRCCAVCPRRRDFKFRRSKGLR